jgi:hypothetical protein
VTRSSEPRKSVAHGRYKALARYARGMSKASGEMARERASCEGGRHQPRDRSAHRRSVVAANRPKALVSRCIVRKPSTLVMVSRLRARAVWLARSTDCFGQAARTADEKPQRHNATTPQRHNLRVDDRPGARAEREFLGPRSRATGWSTSRHALATRKAERCNSRPSAFCRIAAGAPTRSACPDQLLDEPSLRLLRMEWPVTSGPIRSLLRGANRG